MKKKKPLDSRIMSPEDMLKLSDSFGLNLDTSGGSLADNVVITGVSRPDIGAYSLNMKDDTPILFFDPMFFQKTVELTEDSINIKLFK